MTWAPRVSVAIPLYNEEETLPELLRRVLDVLDALPGGPHEIVLVDDGSEDHTTQLLEEAAAQHSRLVAIILSRNFGHQQALTAALDCVSGDVTVVLDGDLQDPPEAIPLLLEEYRNGYDVVYARRTNRKEGFWLRVSYALFYRAMQRLSAIRAPLDAGDFGLMSRAVVEELRRARERHRFLRGLRSWVGFRQIGIPIDRARRHAGKSKYTMRKLLSLASDGIFAFSIVPIRAAAVAGAIAILASGGFALYSVYAKLALHQSPRGFTAITVLITFLAGIQLLFLGIIGEYVGRIYEEVKGRPLYVIKRIVRRGGADAERPRELLPSAQHAGWISHERRGA